MPLEPLNPKEQRLVDQILAEWRAECKEQEEEAISQGYKSRFDYYMANGDMPQADKPSAELVDVIEDGTDEILLWCAKRRFSRWIVAFILGLTFYSGWLMANNHLAIIHWFREATGL